MNVWKVFFLAVTVVTSLQAQAPSLSVHLDDSFKKNAAASRVDGWSGSYKVEQVDGHKCLKIIVADGQQCERKFAPVSGLAELEFEIQAPGPGVQVAAPYLRSGGKNIIKLAFVNGSLRATTGDSIKPLTKIFPTGEWVRLRLRIDFMASAYDAWLGEQQVGTGLPFSEPSSSIDSALFKVSVRSLKVLTTKLPDAELDAARAELTQLKARLFPELAKHPAPLAATWAEYALNAAEAALELGDAAYARECATEAKTLADLKVVRSFEPPAQVCPPVPFPASNPYWAALAKKWKKQSASVEHIESKGYLNKVAEETQGLALALCHPQSPLKGEPATLRRLLVVLELLMQQWAAGKKLGDFDCNQEPPHVYLMLRTVYPDLLTPTRRARWEALIRSNADTIVAQRGAIYRGQKQENLWINADVRHAMSLAWSAQVLDNKEYRRYGDEAMALISRSLQPDGGFAYVGYQNEAFAYHGETPIAQAWYWLATGSSSVKEQLVATKNYYPLSWHPRGMGDHTMATMMKQYWNMSRPGTAALLAAYFAGDGTNLGLSNDKGNLEANASPLAAFTYCPDVVPKPLPDRWLLLDRNTIGPRGRYGDFMFSATTRDPSFGTPKDWDGKLIGNMTSGFVGAIALTPETEVQRILATNATATDDRWPLSAAMQNATCEVKIEKGADLDIVRRTKHRFMAQDQRNALALGNSYSSLSTVYRVTDKITGGDSAFKALPWEGRQAWVLTPDRLVGILALSATEATENLGIHGTLVLVSGRESWGTQRELMSSGKASWTYGNLAVRLLGHDFAAVSTEYTDVFTGNMKKAARILLWDRAEAGEADTLAPYAAGATRYWLVEVKPTWSPAAKAIQRLDKLPDGLWGFELVEAKRSLRLIHNFTGKELRYEADLAVSHTTCSAHASIDHGKRFLNLASSRENPDRSTHGGQGVQAIPISGGSARLALWVPAWGHVLVVCSDDAGDHVQNNSVAEDLFK